MPRLERDRLPGFARVDAGVVDEDVDVAGDLADPLDVLLDRDVGTERIDGAAGFLDDRRDLADHVLAAGADHDLGAGLSEADRERPTETAAATGDQGSSTGEAPQICDAHPTPSFELTGAGPPQYGTATRTATSNDEPPVALSRPLGAGLEVHP